MVGKFWSQIWRSSRVGMDTPMVVVIVRYPLDISFLGQKVRDLLIMLRILRIICVLLPSYYTRMLSFFLQTRTMYNYMVTDWIHGTHHEVSLITFLENVVCEEGIVDIFYRLRTIAAPSLPKLHPLCKVLSRVGRDWFTFLPLELWCKQGNYWRS